MSHHPLSALRPALAVTAGKLAGRASRLSGRGGGTSLPGLVAERIDPDITRVLAAGLPRGALAVSGTNGKTTTSALLAAVLQSAGLHPLHNRAGANMLRGISSALLDQTGADGRLRVRSNTIGLFESDEGALASIVRAVRPRMVVVTNLFRDQLDRYGELDGIAVRWRATFAELPSDATLVLNADDPLVASLGDDARRRVLFYGLDLPAGRFERPPESADSISCRRCSTLLDYDVVYYGHLGHYRCPHCGWARPRPDIVGVAVEPHGLDGTRLQATASHLPSPVTVGLRVPGLYNAYNALAVLAAAQGLDLDLPAAAAAMLEVKAAFGRAERLRLHDRDVWLLLVKNPTGCDEVLHLLTGLPGPLDVVAILNDNAADGHDVSWIWDADFDVLTPHLRHVVCAGTRAEDMALRFKYANGAAPDPVIVHNGLTAIDVAARMSPEGEALYVVATYTAMLELRRGLVGRGVLRHYLERE